MIIRDIRTIPVECRCPSRCSTPTTSWRPSRRCWSRSKPMRASSDWGSGALRRAAGFDGGRHRGRTSGAPGRRGSARHRAPLGADAPARLQARARRRPDRRHERHRHRALGLCAARWRACRCGGCWVATGGACRHTPPAGSMPRGRAFASCVAEMEAYVRHGFRAVKMKVGRNSGIEGSPLASHGPPRPYARCRWRRTWPGRARCGRRIGPDVRLMVDANGAWDVPTAVKMGRAMEPLDIYWYEEPVCPDDVRGSAEVARKVGIAGRRV